MAVERKFVQDRLKRLVIKEWIKEEVKTAGFGGVDVVRTPLGTQVILFVERPGLVIGKGGRKIKMLTDKLREFGVDNPQVSVDEVDKPEFNAQLMASLLARAIERGWYFRRAGYRFLYRIMEAGAKGCEIEISGKLVSERARTEKFLAGTIIHTGDPAYTLVRKGFDVAVKKLGVYGITVRIIPPDVTLPDEFVVKEVDVEQLRGVLNEDEGNKGTEERRESEETTGAGDGTTEA
ncbi:MAG: 30S ribosomal protein S3 [Archaeoglobales archaeon]|nr:30S ribosomal protein S3 [Archaeoglobales archaeon]